MDVCEGVAVFAGGRVSTAVDTAVGALVEAGVAGAHALKSKRMIPQRVPVRQAVRFRFRTFIPGLLFSQSWARKWYGIVVSVEYAYIRFS